jgi:hypothetical protein
MAKAAPRSRSSSSGEQTEVTRLTRELNAAIERQNATAEILASVSRSSTDTRPVFDAILDNLLRLFRTRFALVLLVRNGMFEVGGIKGDLSFEELAKHFRSHISNLIYRFSRNHTTKIMVWTGISFARG